MKYNTTNQNDIKNIHVNSGTVKYVCTDSPYTVRWPSAIKNYVNPTRQDDILKIDVSNYWIINPSSDTTIRVNLNGMNGCHVEQGSGNATVENCTPISSFNLSSGNLTVNTMGATTIESRVNTGNLKNKSNLVTTHTEIKNGVTGNNSLSGNGLKMSLNDNNQLIDREHTDNINKDIKGFSVGSGNLDFESKNYSSHESHNINADQDYVDLAGDSGGNNCTIS